MTKFIVKYRRNNKERYTECLPIVLPYCFDVIKEIFKYTKENKLEIIIEREIGDLTK